VALGTWRAKARSGWGPAQQTPGQAPAGLWYSGSSTAQAGIQGERLGINAAPAGWGGQPWLSFLLTFFTVAVFKGTSRALS